MWYLLCSRGYKNTFSSTVRSKPVAYFFQLNHSHTWHFWTVQHESSVFVWELTILRDSGIRQACFSWERNELILLLTRVMTFAGFLIILMADSTKKKFLIIVATTLYHFVLQSVCAISRWCVVQFAGVWIFSFFHAGEFVQLSWSFRQSHPFTWFPLPLHHRFNCFSGDEALQSDIGVLRVCFCFFGGVLGCPYMCCSASWACSVYTSSFPTQEPKSRCAGRCELRCLSREKKLNLWGQTEDSVCQSTAWQHLTCGVRVLHFTVQEYQ